MGIMFRFSMKVLEDVLSCLSWGLTSHFKVGSKSSTLFFPYPRHKPLPSKLAAVA